ncbi:MAG TPA: hemolysin family protein [Candidatus Deferrimicrobium sp.]|nr:hemolysin family protein [Candidatus Deferrimicrobium sp.]
MFLLEALYLIVAVVGYITAYLVSLYSLAVYLDPDEVEVLFPSASPARRRFVMKLARDPRALMQIANVYKSFILVVITALFLHLGGRFSQWTGVPVSALLPLGLALHWILFIAAAEYWPRRSSRKLTNERLLRHLWVVATVWYLFLPVVELYRKALRRAGEREKVTEDEKDEIVERAIESLAEQAGIGETIVEPQEKEMIGQIFRLDQTVVREIMVPRIDITGIEKSMSFSEIRKLVVADGHSRYPVYDGTIDKIIGMLYVKDLFGKMPEPGETFVFTKYLRQPYLVPETKVIGELLREFKTLRLHIAIVVDEYGGVAGLVTLEDILEEIFGEIQDEHDWEEAEVTKMPDGRYRVSAGLLVEKLQSHLDTDYAQEEYDTVGGLIYDLVGSVPAEGQKITWHDVEFEVDQIEGQRIMYVKVRR